MRVVHNVDGYDLQNTMCYNTVVDQVCDLAAWQKANI